MRRLRRVKIVATLGPASNSEKIIEELARAGADVFRINMSHASHDLMRETVDMIRNVERLLKHPLGILIDLQGSNAPAIMMVPLDVADRLLLAVAIRGLELVGP